ncbi:MAG: translocation/assembly module TamB [Bacteroidales bacterium]|nr:translocation/assembly module TamB [Bacteroidales bacterium]
MLHIPDIQTGLTNKLVARMEAGFHTGISYSKVRVGLFRPIYFEDFLIRDQQADTLIYARKIRITPSFRPSNLTHKKVVLRNAVAEGAFLRMIAPRNGENNYDFLFNPPKKDSTSTPVTFILRHAVLKDSRYQLKIAPPVKKYGVHFTDLNLYHVHGIVDDLTVFNQVTRLWVRKAGFTDSSGWHVNEASTDMEITPRHIWFDNITIVTPWSELSARYYHMDFRHKSDMKDFINKVELSAEFLPSVFGYRDMNMIAQDSLFIRNDFRFSMKARGTLANLTAKNMHVRVHDHTRLSGTLNIIGLPDIRNSYIYFNVENFTTYVEDLRNIYRPGSTQKITVPEHLDNLGKIKYKGNFTGFFTDFVSYGRLETDLGSFDDDISFSADTGKTIHFSGYLGVNQFDLGKFLSQERLLGKITLHTNMQGEYHSKGNFKSKLSGTIDSVEFNHYRYHSVMLDGTFTEKAYDGSIRINDPNLTLDFLGMFDFTQKLPEFDFSLNIPRAALFPLHITSSDTSLLFSGLVLANFKGNNFQDFNGQIKLLDARLQRKENVLNIYNIKLLAYNTPDSGSLKLKSGYLDASLNGKYNFSEVSSSAKSLLARYIPAAIPPGAPGKRESNNFVLNINIHNIDPFTDFFTPQFSIAHNSRVTGRFAPDIHLLSLEAYTDKFVSHAGTMDSLKINLLTNRGLTLDIQGSTLAIIHKIHIDGFRTSLMASGDSLHSYFSWKTGNDTLTRENSVRMLARIFKRNKALHPRMDLYIDSSDIFLNNRMWHLEKGRINMDTSSLQIYRFGLVSRERSLSLAGKLSDNPADTLNLSFHNLNLSFLNSKNEKQLQLEGLLNGKVHLSNVYKTPLFLSDIGIRGLHINHEPLGDAQVVSSWDTLNKRINILFRTDYGTIHPILANGSYSPSEKQISGDIHFDKLKLTTFSSFVSAVFSDVNGIVSGQAHLEGPAGKPDINGQLNLQKTSLTVDYLKTKYTFTSKVPIVHNRFLFNNIKTYDEKGNVATAHGFFSIEDLKNLAIDLTLETNNMLFIHTTQRDNDYFYGTAYGSGVVAIKGPLSGIRMDISAKTGQNTSITLPLYQGKTISAYDYIHFITGKSGQQQKTTGEIRKPMSRGLDLNLDIEVTPDAEVTMLFDPNTGGNLYARGHGNLRMEVKKTGDFNLLGEYTVEKGTYLFSLQNIIQKKFRLESGGKITWNGNPLDANLNILATYPVKTSLYPLFYDENYKKRVPVECQIILKGKLNKPQIRFNIDLPTVDEETRSKVQNAITSEEEMSKQFLSLLILNSFYPDPAYGQPGDIASASALGVTTTEVLSNQLSSWLSQISNDFDVGFSYHPGDQVTSDQVEVALSTQLLNDRVAIYSNIDFSGQNNTTTQTGSNIVGDFQIEVKITQNGKLRIKAFTRANDKYLYETAPYTNGVGIFYREEFSSWKELFRRYWNKLFTKKEKETKIPPPQGN